MHDDDDDAKGYQDCQGNLICESQAGSPDASAAELLGAATLDDVVVTTPSTQSDIAQLTEITAS